VLEKQLIMKKFCANLAIAAKHFLNLIYIKKILILKSFLN